MGDFGIVVVPRDGVDTERIMNHSSVLRKHKVLIFGKFGVQPSTFFTVKLLLYCTVNACSLEHICCFVLFIRLRFFLSQDSIIVVKDEIDHPMSVVSSTKSRCMFSPSTHNSSLRSVS